MNDDDTALLDWVRHYARIVVFSILIGLFGAGVYAAIVPRTFEAWSFVFQRGDGIAPSQFGLVAEAVFHSGVVYGPAMRALHISGPADEFLGKRADLSPVPQTNTLIVVGKAHTLAEAKTISGVTANSLVNAFAQKKIANLALFGIAQPATSRSGLSPSVILTLGIVVGIWIGLAVAVIHYRLRRPVLTLSRTIWALDPDHVTVMEGRRRLLVPRFRGTLANRHKLAQVIAEWGLTVSHLVFLGLSPKEQTEFSRELARAMEASVGATERASPLHREVTLIACNPSAAEADLPMALAPRESRDGIDPRWVELVWIR